MAQQRPTRWLYKSDVSNKHAYVLAREEKSKIKLFMQNEIIMNPKSMKEEWLDDQVSILKNKKLSAIMDYPSAIAAIASRAISQKMTKDDFNLKGVITFGESLKDNQKLDIKEAFGVTPISRYSTEEFGVIATSCPSCGKFHVNDTGYITEILSEEDDKHVAEGELGRVIITDLFSTNMPLLRFDTGDLAIYGGKSDCSFYPTGIVLDQIVGRNIETIYDVNGEKISPFAINAFMRDLTTVLQFQFIQDDYSKNKLLLIVTSEFSKKDFNQIENKYIEILGVKPEISIVDEIPALNSGKRPYIISNIKDKK